MVSNDKYRIIEEIFQEISEEISDTKNQYEPEELFNKIPEHPSDSIVSVTGDNEIISRDKQEMTDTWSEVYGVDAGSSRPIRLRKGDVINVAVSSTGVDGVDANRMEDETVSIVYHARDDVDIEIDKDNIKVNRFPEVSNRERYIEDWVQATSMAEAQAIQGKKVSRRRNAPILIDGPVFPGQSMYFLLHELCDTASVNPYEQWSKKFDEILQLRIDTIEEIVEKGSPIMGFVKTTKSRDILKTIERNAESYEKLSFDGADYATDYSLMSDIMLKFQDNKIVHTDWMYQKYSTAGSEIVQPFKKKRSDLDMNYDPNMYQPVFMYVRIPRSDVLLRVEIPMLVYDKLEPTDLKIKALSEICNKSNVPEAVLDSDDRSNLSTEDRERLQRIVEVQKSYNTEMRNI